MARVFVAFLSTLFVAQGFSASVELTPVADTSLREHNPTNNLGALPFLLVGTGENLTRHRAIMKFDVAGNIPAQSRIMSATLVLELTGLPANGYVPSDKSLYRLLKPWGEGDKVSPTNCQSCLGEGSLATAGEATWFERFAFQTNSWSAPGGEATNDFVPIASSSQTIYRFGESPYHFSSTARMISDVQAWLDIPGTNFGWILTANMEGDGFTARRFGSRENANTNNWPRLFVNFISPPEILSATRAGNQFTLTFEGESNESYVIEFRDVALTNAGWTVLTNIGPLSSTGPVQISDSIPLTNPQRLYRVGWRR